MIIENPDLLMEKKNSPRKWLFLFDGIILLILSSYVFAGMSKVPFHGDESTLIRMSMDWVYIFEDHAPQKVLYNPDPDYSSDAQFNRVLTGTVDPLTIWVAWKIAGINSDDLNGFWNWRTPTNSDEWIYNILHGNMPSPRLLEISRIPSTAFTALSIVVVFIIAYLLSRSRPAAWIAAILYTTTPSILVNGRRAMQEGAMLLFASLVVLCGIYILRALRKEKLSSRRMLLSYGALGLVSAVAMASKYTSILIIAPIYLATFILSCFAGMNLVPLERQRLRFRRISALFGSALLGFAFFYILMPVWWGYGFHWLILLCLSAVCFLFALPKEGWMVWIVQTIPIAMLLLITLLFPLSWNGIYQPIQISILARETVTTGLLWQGRSLPTFQSRIHEMAYQLLTAKPQYYEMYSWESQAGEQSQIQMYVDSHLDGRSGGKVWGAAEFLLILGGVYAALFYRREWETFLLLLWTAVPTGIILLLNPLSFQRYYIILIAPWSIWAGFSAVLIARVEFIPRIRKLFTESSPDAK